MTLANSIIDCENKGQHTQITRNSSLHASKQSDSKVIPSFPVPFYQNDLEKEACISDSRLGLCRVLKRIRHFKKKS